MNAKKAGMATQDSKSTWKEGMLGALGDVVTAELGELAVLKSFKRTGGVAGLLLLVACTNAVSFFSTATSDEPIMELAMHA